MMQGTATKAWREAIRRDKIVAEIRRLAEESARRAIEKVTQPGSRAAKGKKAVGGTLQVAKDKPASET